MSRLAALHRTVGYVTVGIFLVSGMYMGQRFPEAYAQNEAIRHLYRANHVYLLFAGLLNLMAGAYVVEASAAPRRRAQEAGSAFLLLAPALFSWAFLTEPPRGLSHRPVTLLAVILVALGTLCHAIAARRSTGANARSGSASISP
jgi:drug/metabolite transporter (DMT)-like permease